MMEQGEWDNANSEKVRLEEKQRCARREKELEAEQAAAEGRTLESYQPVWFSKVTDEQVTNLTNIVQPSFVKKASLFHSSSTFSYKTV